MMNARFTVTTLLLALFSQVAAAQQRDRAYPPKFEGARVETYKTVGDVTLTMSVFSPSGHKASDKRPGIVFFFGGGFVGGTPAQFHQHCRYFASRGMVAITADYRVKNRHKTTPADSMQDGKDAVRYVRANAKRLGIDPERIVAAGGSAGGLIAACVGVIPNLDTDLVENQKNVSYTPSAMVLFNPAIMGKTPIERTNPDGSPAFTKAIMPWHHVREGLPPSIMFFGTDDRLIKGAKEFRQAALSKGNRCELMTWQGVGHGFFNLGRGGNKHFVETLTAADKFLASLEYVKGEPTVDAFVATLQAGRETKDVGAQRSPKAKPQDGGAARKRPAGRSVAQFLKRLDKNNDGVIEKDELPERLKRRFDRADANKDGKLDAKELPRLRGGSRGKPGEVITGPARGERHEDKLKVGDVAPDFTLADPQGKRKVTLSSFQGKRPVVLIFGSYT